MNETTLPNDAAGAGLDAAPDTPPTPPEAPAAAPAGRLPEPLAGQPSESAAPASPPPTPAAASAGGASGRPSRSARARTGRSFRRVITWLLILLTAVGVLGTSLAFWADRTIFDEDAYVALVAPIAQDPAVVESVSTQVSAAMVEKLGVEKIVAEALPGPSQALAGVVTAGIQSTIQHAIAEFMASDQFQAAWIQANRALHTQLVAVLRGDSAVIQASNGVVAVNVFPLIAKGLEVAGTTLSQATGRPVTLPTLADPSNPDASRAQLEQALGVTLSPDFGVIPVAETSALERAQAAVWLFETSIIVAGLATLLLAVLSVAIALERRKALLQVVVASGIAIAVTDVIVSRIGQLVTDLTPAGAAGVLGQVAIEQVVHGFDVFALALVVILAIVAIALYLVGRPAWVPRWGRSLADRVGVRPSGNPFVRFVAEHIGELRLAGYIVAIVALLLAPVGGGSIVGVVIALVIYQVILTVVRAFRPAYIRLAEDSA